MRAHPLELRERIVAAVDAGHRTATVAEFFGVNRTTVTRYVQMARRGELVPKAIPGRSRRIGVDDERDRCLQLHLHPEATLAEHCQRWGNLLGATPSESTMSRAIQRLGWTRNKRR